MVDSKDIIIGSEWIYEIDAKVRKVLDIKESKNPKTAK